MKFWKFFSSDSSQRNVNTEEALSVADYQTKAVELLDYSWNIVHSAPWKIEKLTSWGDIIHSAILPSKQKIFKGKGTINMNPKDILELIFYHHEKSPTWNPLIVESKPLQVIDDSTHITYQVTAERVGGLVSRRDFVNLAHWQLKDSCYVIAGMSVHHPDAPSETGYIRGYNGPGCWIMKPITDEEKKCELEWYLNTNLKGWLPQYVVDAAFTSIMLDYFGYLRKYSESSS